MLSGMHAYCPSRPPLSPAAAAESCPEGVGMPWVEYCLAVSGLTFIAAGLLVGLFSLARLVMVMARDGLLPGFLARVYPRTQTPVAAQCTVGAVSGEWPGEQGPWVPVRIQCHCCAACAGQHCWGRRWVVRQRSKATALEDCWAQVTPVFCHPGAGVIALVMPISSLQVLVVFGFLFTLWWVSAAHLCRRYCPSPKLRYTQ